MNKLILVLSIAVASFLGGCTDADVVSYNLSKAAEDFQIERRIVFYNGITGEYILSVQGACSVESLNGTLSVTCKRDGQYVKHYLGLSDNVTYFSEQVGRASVSTSNYKVVFKPSVIVPDIDLK